MTTRICIVRKRATVREVARVMRDEHVEDVLVVGRDGEIFGVISARDVVVHAVASHRDVVTMQIAELVAQGGGPIEVAPTATLEAAASLMRANAIVRLPVVHDGVIVGIVSLGEITRYARYARM